MNGLSQLPQRPLDQPRQGEPLRRGRRSWPRPGLRLQVRPDPGKLTPNDPPSTKVKDRSGPRHFAFHPDGKHAYVINEIDCTVTAFDYDADHGTLTAIQTIPTMPVAVEPRHSTAEVVVHPSGKFLYGSNRGHDSLAVYAIEPGTGRLKLVENRVHTRQDPAQFRRRSDRLVRASREHGLRHDRGLQG